MMLPIYRHPSLTVLVDDSTTLLRSVAFQLDHALPSEAFHEPQRALDWLHTQAPMRAAALAPRLDEAGASARGVAFDIGWIHRLAFDPQRFLTPTVVVIDYAMPNMNGLQFCERLAGLPIKKILFTGNADEKTAIDAFNRGLIDRFIRKASHDAFDTLEASIIALQHEYFVERSALMHALLAGHEHAFASDPAIALLATELGARHGIVEHYLFPVPAGILMLDAEGRQRLLIVATEAMLDAHHEMARDNDAPASLLSALEERRMIPFFNSADGMYAPDLHASWHRYCEPARVCLGRQTYYWALFELPTPLDTLVGFKQFLRARTALRRAPRSGFPQRLQRGLLQDIPQS